MPVQKVSGIHNPMIHVTLVLGGKICTTTFKTARLLPTLSEEKNGYAMGKKIVLPGDQLSTSEELLPGD
ncbi:MAG: hypothetical protein KAR20_06610, partial [Candidatus Heimdallarchaeota archaeon]|nr:hypothetical protein [Candidatus Heimdallarchaeota archaeon]